MSNQSMSVSGLALLIALSHMPEAVAHASSHDLLFAQAVYPLAAVSSPETTEGKTTLRINGSTHLSGINTLLEQGFEGKFSSTNVEINYSSTDAALAALQQKQIDLAAIDRPLTDQEKAQNLVAIPLGRENIAVVVGIDNPFAQDLTMVQLIKILQGEITDWAELGGAPAPIRVIQRSPNDPVQQALQRYPILRDAFNGNAQAVQLSDDRPQTLIEALGSDGISFAITDQVMDQPKVRILSMHSILPSDSNYPFSSPLAYVYQGPEPTPAVRAYLDYATTPEMQHTLKTKAPAIASQSGVPNSEAGTEAKPGKASASEKSHEAEQKGTSSKEKSGYSKSGSKIPSVSGYLRLSRSLVFAFVVGIFIWTLFSNNQVKPDETSSKVTPHP
ncbi:MAG: hypothetical protein HC866_05505 [Leptolyngbyaceae cyanobacterium RU_5_1]|nr:hypothetical protein [Leptolyngbyaceae cyanobacterium RU_5_1]